MVRTPVISADPACPLLQGIAAATLHTKSSGLLSRSTCEEAFWSSGPLLKVRVSPGALSLSLTTPRLPIKKNHIAHLSYFHPRTFTKPPSYYQGLSGCRSRPAYYTPSCASPNVCHNRVTPTLTAPWVTTNNRQILHHHLRQWKRRPL
jgi:hypothetical protein